MATLTRGEVRLAYDEAGQGEPAMVFVHGWSCNRAFFGPQFEHFSRQRRCVGVDLRGHGDSDKPRQDYSMEGFADDLAWLCQQLQIERPVVVGHSMGGVVALVLAAQYPELVRAIVMVDGGTRGLTEPEPAWLARLHGLAQPDYLAAARIAVEQMFLPGDDPARRSWIMEQMLATPQHVMLSATEQGGRCDMVAAARACRVPALYIQAGRPRPELARFEQLCPQLVLGRTVGSGHFNQLEVPDQVNAMIERFLQVN
jgi:pimeloyl-ACP methyl ester carboxylesterase